MTKARQIPRQIPRQVVRAISHWPVESQQQSRRNALVASTALTQRRRESLEVEAVLATCRVRHETRARRAAALG